MSYFNGKIKVSKTPDNNNKEISLFTLGSTEKRGKSSNSRVPKLFTPFIGDKLIGQPDDHSTVAQQTYVIHKFER